MFKTQVLRDYAWQAQSPVGHVQNKFLTLFLLSPGPTIICLNLNSDFRDASRNLMTEIMVC